jgi:HEAT repeat protein
VEDLLTFAQVAKGAPKATCIEALEFATMQTPTIADEKCLEFVASSLRDKEPRVKWESAKVIGNVAQLFPTKLDTAINNLLVNSEDEGTVVRWAAAYAIGEILKLKTPINATLLPAVEVIINREEKDSIKKIYHKALKAIK